MPIPSSPAKTIAINDTMTEMHDPVWLESLHLVLRCFRWNGALPVWVRLLGYPWTDAGPAVGSLEYGDLSPPYVPGQPAAPAAPR